MSVNLSSTYTCKKTKAKDEKFETSDEAIRSMVLMEFDKYRRTVRLRKIRKLLRNNKEELAHTYPEHITQSSASRKKKNHHGVKMLEGGKCPFEGCNYINKSGKATTFHEHVKQKHPVETGYRHLSYMCDYCKGSFNCKAALMQHSRNHHEPHRFSCNQCNYTSAQKTTVARHIASKHAGWKPCICVNKKGECVECGKQLKTGHIAHIASCLGYTKLVRQLY
jgi:hypothetical protein